MTGIVIYFTVAAFIFGAFLATPPTDWYETADDYRVQLELPDIKPEDLDISFDAATNTLTIRGERPEPEVPEDGTSRQVDTKGGKFENRINCRSGALRQDAENL